MLKSKDPGGAKADLWRAFQTLLGLGIGHKPRRYRRIPGAEDLAKPPAGATTTYCGLLKQPY